MRATGANGEAEASFSVPDSRGSQSIVRALTPSGARLGEWSLSGSSRTRRFIVGGNDGPHTVILEVCNEEDRCTDSTEQSVQTYGPLQKSFIDIVAVGDATQSGANEGQNLGWKITVNPNGAPADVDVTFGGTGRPPQSFHLAGPGPGADPIVIDVVPLGYDVVETITVTVTDTALHRGSVTKSAQERTGSPPPPEVDVRKGASCNDNGSPGSTPCHTPGDGQPDCTKNSCAFIEVMATNFGSPVSCKVTRGTLAVEQTDVFTQNFWYDTGLAFGERGEDVKVVCDATDSGKSATGTLTW